MSQKKIILTHMLTQGHITPWAAEGVYRVRRLASRIDELVAEGYDIVKETVTDALGQKYTRYSLSENQRHLGSIPRYAPRVRQRRINADKLLHALHERGFIFAECHRIIEEASE